MLPLAHIYVATKVLNRSSDSLVFGSVLPDLGSVSKGKINWQNIHATPFEFAEFIQNNYSDFIDLSLGVKLHSNTSKGVDFYSDDPQIGYAKILGQKLVGDITKNLQLNPDIDNLVFAHKFIEAAVDLHLYQNSPEIPTLYRKVLGELDRDKISQILAKYLKLDQKIIRKELDNFTRVLGPDNLLSIDNAINNIFLYFYPDLKNQPIKPIVQKSLELTRKSYPEFLDQTIKKIKIHHS